MLSRIVIRDHRWDLRFCSECLGDKDAEMWGAEGEDGSSYGECGLRVCQCDKGEFQPLKAFYANPVIWAALVEHHVKKSGALIVGVLPFPVPR